MTDLEPVNTGTSSGTHLRFEPTGVDLRAPETDSWTDVVEHVADLANRIANTDFVPKEYRGKPGQIAATILHGRELGLAPMTALALTNPVKGKPSISAEGMRSLVQQAGHDIELVEASSSRVIMRGRRRGVEAWTDVSWTIEDARRAKITSGANWQSYPRQMLTARATAELCRVVFADVIHGLSAAEELADDFDDVQRPVAAIEASEPTTKVQRRRPRKAATTKETKPVEPTPEPPARQQVKPPEPKPTPEPEPAPSVEDQQREIRELSEEHRRNRTPDPDPDPEPEPEVSDGRPTGPMITNRQNSALMGHWGRLSMMQDRDERILATNVLLGYEPGTVTSTSELRGAEAVTLLGILERLKDRDQLDTRLAGQDQLIHDDQEQ